MKTEKPHIVVLPYPAQGHVPPMVYLARKLASNGFTVTLINITSIHESLSKKWKSLPGEDIRLHNIPFSIHLPSGVDSGILKDLACFMECFEKLEGPLEDVLKAIQPTPRCVVFDYFLTWQVSVVRKLKLTPVCYWPGNAVWCTVQHHVDLVFENGDAYEEGIPIEEEDKVVEYVPGAQMLCLKDYPSYIFQKRTKFLLRHIIGSCDRMKDCEWILANTVQELESEGIEVMQNVLRNKNFVAIGPLFPLKHDHDIAGVSLRDEEADHSLKWLDTKEPKTVLYVSLGSINVHNEESFEKIGAALEESKCPFLFVVPRDWAGEELVMQFCKRVEHYGLVVKWAPQLKVLSHGSIGGFLSHCGWNSTFESICHGVPILGWPCHSEQSMNCKLVAEVWKMGMRFAGERECLEPAEAAKIIREFMTGDNKYVCEIRSRVAAFQEVARIAAKNGGSSSENLHRFMHKMKSATINDDTDNSLGEASRDC